MNDAEHQAAMRLGQPLTPPTTPKPTAPGDAPILMEARCIAAKTTIRLGTNEHIRVLHEDRATWLRTAGVLADLLAEARHVLHTHTVGESELKQEIDDLVNKTRVRLRDDEHAERIAKQPA